MTNTNLDIHFGGPTEHTTIRLVRGLAKPQLFTAFPSILGPVTLVTQSPALLVSTLARIELALRSGTLIARSTDLCSRKDLPQGRVSVGPPRVTPSAFRRGRYKCPRAVRHWVAPE